MNKKNINVAESILLVSSFFMFIYIYQELIFVVDFIDIFTKESLWFIFPIVLLAISIYSFFTRDD